MHPDNSAKARTRINQFAPEKRLTTHNVAAHVFRWEEAFLTAHAEECAARGNEMGLSLF